MRSIGRARELESPEARASGWRAAWWRGVLHMAEGRPSDGLAYFAAVAAELPGELAPKLAMAASYEQAARTEMRSVPVGETASMAVTTNLHAAARSYALVAATDPSYATASFGLARISVELGDREAAAAALQRVPKSSSAYVTAQVALCRVLCVPLPGDPPTVADLAVELGDARRVVSRELGAPAAGARPAPAGSGHVARGAGRCR